MVPEPRKERSKVLPVMWPMWCWTLEFGTLVTMPREISNRVLYRSKGVDLYGACESMVLGHGCA